jgi:NitT/TauT family transport system ATP-binding protein
MGTMVLDAETRLSMQQLLLDVWQKLEHDMTQDTDAAILLSSRICPISARPGEGHQDHSDRAGQTTLDRDPR